MFVPNQKSVKATTKHKSENGEMIKWLQILICSTGFSKSKLAAKFLQWQLTSLA
jgi:hypothetical protein